MSDLVETPTPARHAHIYVITTTSSLRLVRLRRPWEERPREGWALSAFEQAPGARRTREGVCSAAHGPAHPVDGSLPRSRARRVYLHGESSGARAGMAIRSHDMPMPAARCPWCSLCLPPISGRHLRAIWSHTDLLGGPGAAQSTWSTWSAFGNPFPTAAFAKELGTRQVGASGCAVP